MKDNKFREREPHEILTKQEYNALLRFGIGPRETPTAKQKIVYDRADVKVRRERRRYNQVVRRLMRRSDELLTRHKPK